MSLLSRERKTKRMTPVRTIVISFFVIIMVGTFLLTMPFSSRSGAFTPVENAMFTATSTTCVTGLAVYDTWQYWSDLGQVIILLLIQVGGLGLIAFTTGFTLLLRQKLGLKDIALARENVGSETVNVRYLLRTVFIFTFSVELIGTLLLMIRFVPQSGAYGIWLSAFTAISAFCNAGFDLFSSIGPGISTVTFAADPLVALTLSGLIVVGGLGFIVVIDIFLQKLWPCVNRRKTKRLSFHTMVVLVATGVLLLGGAAAILISEYRHALSDYNFFEKCVVSIFQSASSRTAGFAPIDPANQTSITKIFSILLMFIGGSPGSTAGGIKTTTILVLFATIFSVLIGRNQTIFLRRHISHHTVYESLTIFFSGGILVLITTFTIMLSVPGAGAIDALYEATSAFSTTGFNAPFTPNLGLVSKIALILTMFVGRVGPVSLGLSFVNRKNRHSESILPDGKLMVG